MSEIRSDNRLEQHPKPVQEYERKLVDGVYEDWADTAEIEAVYDEAYRSNKYFWIAGNLWHCTDGVTYRQVSGGGGNPFLTERQIGFGNSANELGGNPNFTYDKDRFCLIAGGGDTTPSNVNFLGNNAGVNAPSANGSNFIGNGAGLSATNASGANFIGSGAGQGATNATSSNFIGANAGNAAPSANESNFIGYSAGTGATGANQSNFIGYAAGNNADNANNSIFIGTGAGLNDTVDNSHNEGDYSILIGGNTSTGGFKNSVAIGQGTINTAENQMMIGSSLRPLDVVIPDGTMQIVDGTQGAGKVLTSDANGLSSWKDIPYLGYQVFFMQATASDVSTYYKELNIAYSPTTALPTQTVTASGQVLYNFITDAGSPNIAVIPKGNIQVNLHAAQSAGTKTCALYAEIWETDAAGTDIALIATTGVSIPLVTLSADLYVSYELSAPYVMTSANSRVATRVKAITTGGGSNPQVYLNVGGVTDSRTILPSPTPSGGTPSLTAAQIAFGDGSNLMTSSSGLVYDVFFGDFHVAISNGGFQADAANKVMGDYANELDGSVIKVQTNETGIAYYDNTAHTGKFGINTSTPSVALDVVGDIQNTTTIKTGGYTVATLPAGVIGMMTYVTDADTPTYLATVVGGGGVTCPVFYDGSAWVCH